MDIEIDPSLTESLPNGRVAFYLNPYDIECHKADLQKAFKYAKLIEEGTVFPPITVHYDETIHKWRTGKPGSRSDGAHRITSHKMLGRPIRVVSDELPESFGRAK